MDKEDIDICNGILLSHKKEWNSAICRDLDGHRDSYREKSEKLILYIIAYIRNLEKWYRSSYLQSRNRDTDIEKMGISRRKARGGMSWEFGIDIYRLLILCITLITNENLLYSTGNSLLCGDLNGKEIQKKRGHRQIYCWFTLLYSRNTTF